MIVPFRHPARRSRYTRIMIARTEPVQAAAETALAELALVGPDAATFLQGYLTCDTDALEEGVGTPMALCNIKGRVLANGWASGAPDHVALIVHATVAEALSAHLAKYLVFARSKLDAPAPRTVVPSGRDRDGIELRPFGWRLAATSDDEAPRDVDRLCIDAGFAVVSAPVAERFLPQMLGLTDIGAVSFAKGCYLGQEVVARAQHRGEVKRRIRRFRYRGARPAPGTGTTPAGTVMHAASEGNDSGLALVVTGAGDAKLAAPNCRLDTA